MITWSTSSLNSSGNLAFPGTLTFATSLRIRQPNQKAMLCLPDGFRYSCPSSKSYRRDDSLTDLHACCVQYNSHNLYKFLDFLCDKYLNKTYYGQQKNFWQQESFQKQKMVWIPFPAKFPLHLSFFLWTLHTENHIMWSLFFQCITMSQCHFIQIEYIFREIFSLILKQ